MTYTFSAIGTAAPIFITVYGMNEREMPEDKCSLVPLQGYLKNILIPFVKDSRHQFDGLPRDAVEIPDELSAVSWCDGNIKQIKTIIRNLPEYTAMKISANKYNPARLGVDQPCDVTDTFKIIKRM